MEITSLGIEGCYLVKPPIFQDKRGSFVKSYHAESFAKYGLSLQLKEEFFTTSKKDVFRGMHFQRPPHAHTKYVFCSRGAVLDYFVDIRNGSPTYGKSLCIELSQQNGLALLLPPGIAHGFLSLSDESVMFYKTDCSYAPDSDDGILFSSCNLDIPADAGSLIVSDRDYSFTPLQHFNSPFIL